MNKEQLTQRTRTFAVRIFKLLETVPNSQAANVVTHQLLKAASSVAANYRTVNRAKSRADFGNKLKIVLEEADECHFWLGFGADVGVVEHKSEEVKFLTNEADELVAIFNAAVKTVNESKSGPKS